jgi:hypothetical protein
MNQAVSNPQTGSYVTEYNTEGFLGRVEYNYKDTVIIFPVVIDVMPRPSFILINAGVISGLLVPAGG